jgi:hypothetical protein
MPISKRLNKIRYTTFTIDSRLEKHRGKVLFPKKLALANKLIANAKLP